MKRLAIGSALMVVAVGAFLTVIAGTTYAQEVGGVAASGTANAKITIALTDTTMALGTPDPSCEGLTDGTATGEFVVYNGTTGNEGCSYVWGGLSVTIKSNRPWTGTTNGSDGTPTSGVTVVGSSFHYSTSAAASTYTGCAGYTALATTTASFEASGTQGNSLYNFYHCVLIDWDDSDGTIDSTITYTVSQ